MNRWPIVVGAALTALTMATPIILPRRWRCRGSDRRRGRGLDGGHADRHVVGLVTYTSIFTMLGVWLKRHIVRGLAYILIWEGFIALGGRGVAQFAIRTYTRSVLVDRTAPTSSAPTSPCSPRSSCRCVVSVVALVTRRLASRPSRRRLTADVVAPTSPRPAPRRQLRVPPPLPAPTTPSPHHSQPPPLPAPTATIPALQSVDERREGRPASHRSRAGRSRGEDHAEGWSHVSGEGRAGVGRARVSGGRDGFRRPRSPSRPGCGRPSLAISSRGGSSRC